MPNFKELKKEIEQNRRISQRVIDEFLLYYAAEKDGLDRTFDNQITRYRHIVDKIPQQWKNYLKSQFIVHRIFKSGGLISKYINHVDVQNRSDRQLTFLQQQKENPWRFSFAEIIANPHSDFYTMHDLFTGEEYMVYSQSITQLRFKNPDIQTWFNLISPHETCAQTFGTVYYFQSFNYEDITFFAREIDPDLETDQEIANHIDNNPLPYTMLWSGATLPPVAHGDHFIRHMAARYYDDDFSSEPFQDQFQIEYARDVYRLSLTGWNQFPHFAVAYFDEREDLLHLTAMTDIGFKKLVEAVNNGGYELPLHPHDDVSPGMMGTASDILRRDITLNPFENQFEPEEDQEQFTELNHFLGLLVDAINNDRQPDIKKMADKAGVDYETAAEIARQMIEKSQTNFDR